MRFFFAPKYQPAYLDKHFHLFSTLQPSHLTKLPLAIARCGHQGFTYETLVILNNQSFDPEATKFFIFLTILDNVHTYPKQTCNSKESLNVWAYDPSQMTALMLALICLSTCYYTVNCTENGIVHHENLKQDFIQWDLLVGILMYKRWTLHFWDVILDMWRNIGCT